jgi:sulfate/thiosulfate transport system substrate-binding protein
MSHHLWKNVLRTTGLAGAFALCFGVLLTSGVQSVAQTQTVKIPAAETEILNVSYDPTRELYRDVNAAFIKSWKLSTGQDIAIRQSHGGSGKQARAVIDGLGADVVTLALAGDIDEISRRSRKIPSDWASKLSNNSAPYTSTIVFVVRKGNPKGIKDWNDLVRKDVAVMTPNPKTSGGARWNYLAAWGWAQNTYKDEAKVRDYIAQLFNNVPVLDAGARASTTTFAQRGIGDVLISWENEAFLIVDKFDKDGFEIIVPSLSILAEPSVAVVEENGKAKGTQAIAEAYLKFLYTPKGQELIVKHHFRPLATADLPKNLTQKFVSLPMQTIDEHFGGWTKANAVHFAEGGTFDQLYKPQANAQNNASTKPPSR